MKKSNIWKNSVLQTQFSSLYLKTSSNDFCETNEIPLLVLQHPVAILAQCGALADQDMTDRMNVQLQHFEAIHWKTEYQVFCKITYAVMQFVLLNVNNNFIF